MRMICVHRQVLYSLQGTAKTVGLSPPIFSPYESALRADDGCVPYFPICQGTLPWQPNNIGILKAN